jgi:polysaccharide biosynthesis transport protein
MSRNFELMQEIEKQRSTEWGQFATRPVPDVRSAQPHKYSTEARNDAATEDLVQRVFRSNGSAVPRVVVCAGLEPGAGCSEIAISVARTLAAIDTGQVCLVDANFRAPSLAPRLETPNHYGLTEALNEETPIRSIARPQDGDRLWLLSSGTVSPESPRLLSSDRVRARFDELRSQFSWVVIDAPPLSRFPDAMALGKLSDGLILVITAESSRREAALSIVQNLREARISILGAVLNKRTFPIPELLYKRL